MCANFILQYIQQCFYSRQRKVARSLKAACRESVQEECGEHPWTAQCAAMKARPTPPTP